MTDTKELIIMNLYQEKKIKDSLYKCTVIDDTNVAYTVTVTPCDNHNGVIDSKNKLFW